MSERAPEPIRSASNSIVKYVRSLERRSIRRRERAFVVEGRRAVDDALQAGAKPTLILLREDVATEFDPSGLPVEQSLVRSLSPAQFDQLAGTVHPQGVLAVFPTPQLPMPSSRLPLFLVVDGLRDPGNLGTLLRSAAGAGATTAVVTAGTVDPFNPKTVRAAMGAHFRLPIVDYDELVGEEIRAATTLRVVARVGDHPPPDAMDWRQPATLIVAAETGDESQVVQELATNAVAIPMVAGMDSLNAAVAAAVILFEAARQRRPGRQCGAVAPSKPD